VLPFYPAFLAGMNLGRARRRCLFAFLVSWEFMSLSSWALVMAHHRVRDKRTRRLHLPRHGRASAR